MTWLEHRPRYFGAFLSRAEAEKWIDEHHWLTKQTQGVFDKGQGRPFLDQLLNSNCRELGVKLRSYSAMQRDIELIFPIKDVASAALMTIKADCLHKAGIINEAEKQHVHSRARTFLDDATLKDAA